jgi:hypothetical protein
MSNKSITNNQKRKKVSNIIQNYSSTRQNIIILKKKMNKQTHSSKIKPISLMMTIISMKNINFSYGKLENSEEFEELKKK